MRIAFVVGSFPSLSETFVVNQIVALLDRGHDVDIYAARRGDVRKRHPGVDSHHLLDRTTYSREKPRRYPVRVWKALGPLFAHPLTNPLGRLRALNFFKHGEPARSLTLLYHVMPFLPQRRYDVIHCHFAPNAIRVVLAHRAGILRGKVLTTFHGYDVNTYPRQYGRDVYRDVFRTCELFTANSSFTMRRAVALGCPAGKLIKLPMGVDLDSHGFGERRLAEDEKVRVLTVGRLVEVKGIEYGLRAVAIAARQYPNLRYEIVGDGPLKASLASLAAKLGIADQVAFLGGCTEDEVRRCYGRGHLFMLPGVVGSDGAEEAQGIVLLEAQAGGLPVLATRVGGIPESVVDGVSGFLVGERDVEALAERLVWLIEHPQRWAEMGRAGRAHVEAHFDIEQLNDRLVAIYQTLLAGGRPGDVIGR